MRTVYRGYQRHSRGLGSFRIVVGGLKSLGLDSAVPGKALLVDG